MATEHIETKAKLIYKDTSKEKLRLMYLYEPQRFFDHIESYAKSMPPTPSAQLLSVVCEGCGIRPYRPLPNNFEQAKAALMHFRPDYESRQKPTSTNYNILHLELRTLLHNKQFLENADAIFDFAAKFTRFIVGVREACVMNPNNHDLKKLKSDCEKMFGAVQDTLKTVKKAQASQIELQHKADLKAQPKPKETPMVKQSARDKLAEEFLNHPNNRNSRG